jgi:hypothetical protein
MLLARTRYWFIVLNDSGDCYENFEKNYLYCLSLAFLSSFKSFPTPMPHAESHSFDFFSFFEFSTNISLTY